QAMVRQGVRIGPGAPADLVGAFRIRPKYERLARALMRVLEAGKIVSRDRSEFRFTAQAQAAVAELAQLPERQDALGRQLPDLKPHIDLLDRCSAALGDTLSGARTAGDVLFPSGAMDLVEPIYRNNRWSDHFNDLAARATARVVAVQREHLEPGEKVCILE